jgi:hypothetical protein
MKQAARLFGSADALRKAVGGPQHPIEWPAAHQSAIATARSQLGEEVFTAAWTRGREMTIHQAAAAALRGHCV